jgi:hypothetical protein
MQDCVYGFVGLTGAGSFSFFINDGCGQSLAADLIPCIKYVEGKLNRVVFGGVAGQFSWQEIPGAPCACDPT